MDNILLVIQEAYINLPNSEKKVADYILKNPQKVLLLNTQGLADASGSSSAAVMRMTKSIGLDGFLNLKFHLSRIEQDTQKNYSEIFPSDTSLSIGKKVFTRLTYSLEKTKNTINEDNYKIAVEYIKNSNFIYLFGLGASSLVARDLFQKFSRIGITVFFSEDYHTCAAAMASQKGKSVLISVSQSGETLITNQICKVARKLDFKIISITSDNTSSLAQLSDIVLSTNTSEEFKLRSTATVSTVTQLYVADILFLTYSSSDYESSLEILKISKEITRLIDKL